MGSHLNFLMAKVDFNPIFSWLGWFDSRNSVGFVKGEGAARVVSAPYRSKKHMKNSFMIEMPNRKLFKKNHFDKRCWKITHIKGSLAKNWLISVWMHQRTKQSFSCFQYLIMKIISFCHNHLISIFSYGFFPTLWQKLKTLSGSQ